MIITVLFDVDGTLIDSFHRNLDFYRHIFAQAGVDTSFLNEDLLRGGFHLPLQDCLRHLSPIKTDAEIARLVDVYHNLDWDPEDFILMPHVAEIIPELHKNYQLGIVTGRQQMSVTEFLSSTKLEAYFDAVIHHGIYTHAKPHPEPILLGLEQLNAKPEETVYVGDTQVDIDSSKAAGVKSILCRYEPTGNHVVQNADASFDDYRKLPEILVEL